MSFDPATRTEEILGSPPRLEPLRQEELSADTMEVVFRVRELHSIQQDATPHTIITTLGRNPPFFRHFFEAAVLFGKESVLPARARELAILRTGWLCGAPYVWGEHVAKAWRTGLTSEEIERVTQGSAAPGWSEDDRAILKAAEELHDNAMISDTTWAELSLRLDEQQIIEVPMLVGHYHTAAFVQNSLRLVPRSGNPGLGEAGEEA